MMMMMAMMAMGMFPFGNFTTIPSALTSDTFLQHNKIKKESIHQVLCQPLTATCFRLTDKSDLTSKSFLNNFNVFSRKDSAEKLTEGCCKNKNRRLDNIKEL